MLVGIFQIWLAYLRLVVDMYCRRIISTETTSSFSLDDLFTLKITATVVIIHLRKLANGFTFLFLLKSYIKGFLASYSISGIPIHLWELIQSVSNTWGECPKWDVCFSSRKKGFYVRDWNMVSDLNTLRALKVRGARFRPLSFRRWVMSLSSSNRAAGDRKEKHTQYVFNKTLFCLGWECCAAFCLWQDTFH